VKHFQIPRDEVMGWSWGHVMRYYVQCGRMEWDAFVGNIQAQEIAISRALAASLGGKKPKPIGDYKDEGPFSPNKGKRKPNRMNLMMHLNSGQPIPDSWDVSEWKNEDGSWIEQIQTAIDKVQARLEAETRGE